MFSLDKTSSFDYRDMCSVTCVGKARVETGKPQRPTVRAEKFRPFRGSV